MLRSWQTWCNTITHLKCFLATSGMSDNIYCQFSSDFGLHHLKISGSLAVYDRQLLTVSVYTICTLPNCKVGFQRFPHIKQQSLKTRLWKQWDWKMVKLQARKTTKKNWLNNAIRLPWMKGGNNSMWENSHWKALSDDSRLNTQTMILVILNPCCGFGWEQQFSLRSQ